MHRREWPACVLEVAGEATGRPEPQLWFTSLAAAMAGRVSHRAPGEDESPLLEGLEPSWSRQSLALD